MTKCPQLPGQSYSAPYPRLLKPHAIPTETERRRIQVVIGIAKECLSSLNKAIDLCADQPPEEISLERDRRSDFIEQHKQILERNIVCILTDDITLEIFEVCVQLDVENRPEDDAGRLLPSKHMECPLLLTHVCSKWRQIALSSPLLWNTIFYKNILVASSESNSRVIEMRFDRIEAWLERSGLTCPLFVRIDWYQASVGERMLPGNGGDGLRLLVSQSHRWVTADMYLPDPAFCETLASMVPTAGFPQLKRLCVLPLMQTSPPQIEGRRTSLGFTDLTSILPWGQLTHLSVAVALSESISESHWCQALFDAVPFLGSLHLTVKLGPTTSFRLLPRSHAQDIHHLRLQNLTLDFEVMNLSNHFDCLLGGLTLPCLNKLSLAAYGWGAPSVISSFFMRHPSLEFIVLRICTPYEVRGEIFFKQKRPYVSLMRVGLGSDSRYHHHYAGEPVTRDFHDWNIHRRRLGRYEETTAGRIHYADAHPRITHLRGLGQDQSRDQGYEEIRTRKIELQENSNGIRQISMPLIMQRRETNMVTLPPGANWAIISQGNHPLEVL
ncbi:hypothetical protein K435DRAFT_839674 [Dendrothele bispora CBS 962.96]|uniref:Uncharacterized protein n=1 Tax=Dendrothele bispora (strain CBS 962.96) TaxID=1314807 RepID=A0A4S8LYU7_DENBC|nr:hypothetical protein K435DRAFT_839674 [Dendrothele bispora CBS 962.96]